MDTKTYIRRAGKSIIYIGIIFILLLGIMYTFSEKTDPSKSFLDTMIPEGNRLPLTAFIVIFGLVYPFITFVKKNVYLNKSFDEEKNNVMRVFENSGYELTAEEDTKLYFRPKNKLSRIMRMTEDTVILDYSDNPLILNGMRKEVFRLAKHIQYLTTQEHPNN